MEVTEVRTDELMRKAAPYNPRQISDHDLEALRRSLRFFGTVEPIVVNRRSDRIVGGHQRVKAALAEEIETLPVVYVDLDEPSERQLNLALNRIHGEWDEEKLATLLQELSTSGADLSLTGFESGELDALLASLELPAGSPDPDEIPPIPEAPKARTGDLIVLGAHRLLCGDARNAGDVKRLLGDELPKLLLTDPPYGVGYDARWRDGMDRNDLAKAEPTNANYMRSEAHRATGIEGDTKADWSDAFELVPSLEYGYIWHASRHQLEVETGLRRIGWEVAQQIIWVKPVLILSRQHYHWRHEPCLYARRAERGSPVPWYGSRDQSTVWEIASPKQVMAAHEPEDDKVNHPTQKPVLLYSTPLTNHMQRGECFYEPFCGSGTALIAAEMNGRRCLAMEIDPIFIDVAVQRWQEYTGRKAEGWRGND
jgi:DNA modification methylase